MPKNKTSSGDNIDDMVADIYSRFVVHKGINDLDLSRKERSALQGVHTGDPKTMERVIKKALLSVKEETEMTDYDQLDEWGLSGGSGDAHGGEIDANDLFDLSSRDVLQRLNTFVKSVNDRTYVNPATPLARIREKLSVLGIGVEMIPLVGDTGSIELPLRQWGGIFDPYTGVTEDGISDKTEDGNGLNLSLTWSVGRNGRYTIEASIESAAVAETEVDADAAAVEEEFEAAHEATVSERMDPEVFKQKLSDLAKKNDMDKTVAKNKADQKRKDKEREETASLDEIKFSGRSSIKYKVAKKIQRGIQSVVAKSSTGKERGLQTPQDRKADLDGDRETRKNFGGKASKIRFKSGNGSKLLKVPASKLSAKKLQGMKSEDADGVDERITYGSADRAKSAEKRKTRKAGRAARSFDADQDRASAERKDSMAARLKAKAHAAAQPIRDRNDRLRAARDKARRNTV